MVPVFLIASVIQLCHADAQDEPRPPQKAASFSVTAVTKKREYNVGDEWVYEFTARVTAPKDQPLTIRAWKRFFAVYEAWPEFYGARSDANLSDVLATGGQIWRDGVPVVLWNAPEPSVFAKTAKTVVAAGKTASTTFRHTFGGAVKPGHFQYKVWFAIVVEPEPDKYMLLFSRKPIEVKFTVEGTEIEFDTYLKHRREWDKSRNFQFHHEVPLSADDKTG